MKRTVLVILSFCLFLLSYASSVSACSCVETPGVEAALEQSDAVFHGKVLDIRENTGKYRYGRHVLFEVMKTWKGIEDSQVIIKTGLGGGDCGFDFQVGQEYVVYAYESEMYGDEKALVAIICSRTAEIGEAEEDLQILGEGNFPQNEVELSLTTEEMKDHAKWVWRLGIAGTLLRMVFFN